MRTTARKPLPNPDPERYVLVHTKETSYYRLKRGLGKPARLNTALQTQAVLTRQASPAARALRQALFPFLNGLDTGRFIARVSALLRKALTEAGRLHYAYLLHYEVQPRQPLGALLLAGYAVQLDGGQVRMIVPGGRKVVKRHSPLVSHYYFELVLLTGIPGEGSLQVDSVESKLYPIDGAADRCVLAMDLPEASVPWMALLKVSCLEGNELAYHPRHYGMKVVAVGG